MESTVRELQRIHASRSKQLHKKKMGKFREADFYRHYEGVFNEHGKIGIWVGNSGKINLLLFLSTFLEAEMKKMHILHATL